MESHGGSSSPRQVSTQGWEGTRPGGTAKSRVDSPMMCSQALQVKSRLKKRRGEKVAPGLAKDTLQSLRGAAPCTLSSRVSGRAGPEVAVIHRYVFHNDRIAPIEQVRLSAGHAGLLIGWGLFTTR